MKLKGLNIIVISNEAWGDVWYSKHNYAYELSKHNDVVFINPPEPWSLSGSLGCRISVKRVMENLRTLQYNNMLPAFSHGSYRLNNAWVSRAIRKQLQAQQWPVDLILSFDPARLHNPLLLGAKASLFIAVDKYILSLRGEPDLYRNVDGIVAISRSFNDFYQPYGKPLLNIGHGISDEEFSAVPVKHPYGEFGLYMGGIDRRVDIPLIQQIVEQHPETSFVFIGEFKLQGNGIAEDLFVRGKYKNVHYLGVLPYKVLKSWVAASHFCLAPMDVSHSGNMISSHKLLNYLAMGKPIFSNVFSEYAPDAHLLYMDNDQSALLGKLSRFLGSSEPEQLRQERIAYARGRSYEVVLGQIGEFISNCIPLLQPEGK